ncbi:U-box domain-containing protein 13 [Glycine soja]|uniref:RING-type E3 ubiquitin transferase n=1 Tax=Glycine soja TaxID=3848 RepID=A0A0B2QY97_GLYSO|nr:U-box domain-containing protein 13 [Glycine soja]
MESGNNIVSPTEDFSRHTHEPYAKLCPESLHIPYEFRCPISLVIMKDPVIICTGQFQVCMTPTPGGLVNSMVGNKGQAITAGIVPKLIEMLTEPDGDMRDEALAVMAVVAAGHSEGQATIGSMNVVSTLVELVSNGPPRNKENATSVLVIL